MADLPQLCLSEGKSGPEEAPLVPGTAWALSGRWQQQSRNTLSFSSGITDPLHSITSLGKRSTDNEHSLVVEADVYFIYTFFFSFSLVKEVFEKIALELYLSLASSVAKAPRAL